MKRREFAIALGATSVLARPAWAASEPVEDKDFTRLPQPIPVALAGKVEVIEFFGYWCPHCATFEPKLDAWARALPADVNFRRVPVGWQDAQEPYQRMYFALEALGLLDTLHAKVFQAVQVDRLRLKKDADFLAFATTHGLDGAKLVAAANSAAVSARVRAANQLVTSYRVDGVPTLAVHGRFMTSPAMAGSAERALQVVDALIRQARTTK
ncbi:MAG: thiol:disulfide interchange protein DsbA/DsbL [Rubrivivax sp.]|nr:thiol:disulfide interchange protein DsbA/DsbL [Rubrivivax sp.]